MIYTVNGTIKGKPYSVTWKDGQLEGDPLAVDLAKIEADVLQRAKIPVGPVGMYLPPDLKDPLAALFVIREVFDPGIEVTGEVPQPPTVPEDAVV